MSSIKYNQEHIWVTEDEYGMIVVGISDFAQEQLGDIVYVEVPDVGREVIAGDDFAIIESVKTTSEISAPITGTIYAVNEVLGEQPEIINESPFDDGWLVRIETDDLSQLSAMMDEDAYQEYVESEA